jgi:phosphoribosylglycinamide formyltransferase 1
VCPTLRNQSLRVAVLTTRRAPGLERLLEHEARDRDWTIAVAIATDPTADALSVAAARGVPTCVHDLGAFACSRGTSPASLAVRPDFDRSTQELLEPFGPELILLCGYLHIVTDPLLAAHPERVVNIHDSDLLSMAPDGRPRYRGLHSTRDAIFAGEPETRSTVHLAVPEVDAGPPLLRSWGFPTHPLVDDARRWGASDILKAYAYAQREWMMEASWGALLAETVGHFARDEVRRVGDRMVVGGSVAPRELEPPSAAEKSPLVHGRRLGTGG